MKAHLWSKLVIAALCLIAAAPPPSPMLAHAKSLISAHMVDPTSLQFRKTRVVHRVVDGKSLTIACGEFNARNKFGGYTGFTGFAYEATTMHGVLSWDGASDFSFFADDGGSEMDHPGSFNDANASILAVCVGIS